MIPTAIKRLLGILPQEYVCVARESIRDTPHVVLTRKGSADSIDVTHTHVLLGYKPLIIGISYDAGVSAEICLTFSDTLQPPNNTWRGFPSVSTAIALLQMRRLDDSFHVPGFQMYEGIFGEHSFLNFYQSAANNLAERIRRKPPSDANISGNLYEQVRIAYSVPRQISVVSVKDHDLLNFFPTDLHGAVSDNLYISSLRMGGMVCSQVETLKNLVLSSVDVEAFRKTYGLGKNHMQPLKPPESFEPTVAHSPLGIPLYPHATTYLELELVQMMDHGIHRLFLYRVKYRGEVKRGKTLAHIHSYYAQWRLNHGKSTEYFFR
jgi:flavin reductase (DIM6/NTAB) family NADH-FMN oxidoreductase RutF